GGNIRRPSSSIISRKQPPGFTGWASARWRIHRIATEPTVASDSSPTRSSERETRDSGLASHGSGTAGRGAESRSNPCPTSSLRPSAATLQMRLMIIDSSEHGLVGTRFAAPSAIELGKSPRDRVLLLAVRISEPAVAIWCAELLNGSVEAGDPRRPPIAWLGGRH